jgi:hypothetical protein
MSIVPAVEGERGGGVGILRVKVRRQEFFILILLEIGTVNDGIVIVNGYNTNESMILNDSTIQSRKKECLLRFGLSLSLSRYFILSKHITRLFSLPCYVCVV